MKKFLFLFFVILIMLTVYSANIEHWKGILSVSGINLTVVFNIQKGETITGTMDSIEQNKYGIPLGKISIINNKWNILVPIIGGKYEGIQNGNSIEGKWYQSGLSLPLTLKKVNSVNKPIRPQTPKPPFPYIVKNIRYKNEKENFYFGGTLTIPKGRGPFPAVMLITGSGAQDRDETIFNHKPFLVLADYLTRHGIAVLRVDDRGVNQTGSTLKDKTIMDLANDVIYGIEFLKSQKNIDKNGIGLIGHSEGGLIAPIVASKLPTIKYIILLAAPSYDGEKIIIEQTRLLSKAAGIDNKTIKENIKQMKKIYKWIKHENNPKILKKKLHDFFYKNYQSLSSEQKKSVKNIDLIIKEKIAGLTSPSFKFFLTYDPSKTLAKVKCPVLALGCSLDLQVPAKENLNRMKKIFKKSGNKNVTIIELNGLNHLFQPAKTGAISEYKKIEITVEPKVLKIISNWINKTYTELKNNTK